MELLIEKVMFPAGGGAEQETPSLNRRYVDDKSAATLFVNRVSPCATPCVVNVCVTPF